MNGSQFWVVVGPVKKNWRHAVNQGWRPEACVVTSSVEEFRMLDPTEMRSVSLVDMGALSPEQVHAFADEMWILRTVWPEIRIISTVDVAAQVDAGRLPVFA